MQTVPTVRRMNPPEALEWIRKSLVEMCEYHGNPEFVAYSTPLTQQMIDYLWDRAEIEHVVTRKGSFDLKPGEPVRHLIHQIDTDGRF